ncbi:MAG: hypothetical protein HGN29_12985 [Asgard group archaeon]|nr:hypothetical protein [Asgard group archaeon]
MSGYSPTWTNKGSDKLRALQVTKILMNSLKRIISSFDTSKKETEDIIVTAIAGVVYNNFTPHRDLSIEEQYDLLVEVLGWKNLSIEKQDENAIIQLGANRFVSSDTKDLTYILIVTGIMKALGYFLFDSNVMVETIPSQFQSQQLQMVIQKIDQPIPSIGEEIIPIEATEVSPIVAEQIQKTVSEATKPLLSVEDEEIKPSIDLELETVFSPILQNYPVSILLPIFHQVLAEISTTFFGDIEDNNVKKAKAEFTELHIRFLIEFLLINIRDSEQDIREISVMIGQYIIKALKAKSDEDLTKYLPEDIKASVSRRVAYVEFPARGYCTYAPGEKCVEGKRDLCDFVLYMWEGFLQILLPEKNFKVGERIPATRRGNFCLVEFLKNE